jgi:hypothetical protein
MQQWTYDELTRAVEAEIRRQLGKVNTDTYMDRRMRREYAFGAYLAWEAILRQHPSSDRNTDDARRLRELVNTAR